MRDIHSAKSASPAGIAKKWNRQTLDKLYIDGRSLASTYTKLQSLYPSDVEDLYLYMSFCVWGFLCKLNKFCANTRQKQ